MNSLQSIATILSVKNLQDADLRSADLCDADKRIPDLLKLRRLGAKTLFASYEPALGPVDFDGGHDVACWLTYQWRCDEKHSHSYRHEDGSRGDIRHHHHDDKCKKGIDWLIIGAQTGSGAKPPEREWIQRAVDQCRSAGVPVFCKSSIKKHFPDGEWPQEWPAESQKNEKTNFDLFKIRGK